MRKKGLEGAGTVFRFSFRQQTGKTGWRLTTILPALLFLIGIPVVMLIALQSAGKEITPTGPADRGIMFYSPVPGTECVPSQQCLRTVLTFPSGSSHLLGAGELEPSLRQAASLTGKTVFTVLIHQFFRQTGSRDAAFLCVEILPG